MKSFALSVAVIAMLIAGVACSQHAKTASYKDSVKNALEQAELKDVTVNEDADKNTITLGGSVHSNEAKQKAGEVAQTAAADRVIVNEVSVQPVGNESDAKAIQSNVDDAIEKSYKAGLIARGLDKQGIRFDAKNGVLTLKGQVKDMEQRQLAEQVATNVPQVGQVVNEIQVKR
ncbi:MAG TPA: BON domain-containing protein [Terriglobales bacterium]|jgi:osmotically-inducible protein OsmY